MADHVLAYLRRVMTWHAARSDDFRSPIVRGMARTRPSQHGDIIGASHVLVVGLRLRLLHLGGEQVLAERNGRV